jgi:hypothetical protein
MKRLVLTLLIAAATVIGTAALGLSGVAVAQYPPAGTPGITTNVPSVPPGGNFTATVGACLPGETVVITFQGVSKTVTCNSTTLQATAAFAAPATPGTYQVCADLTGSGATLPAGTTRPLTVCTSILVAASGPTVPATVPGAGLPATGSSGIGTTTTSAIVLVSAGILLLIVTQVRRRRAAQTTA